MAVESKVQKVARKADKVRTKLTGACGHEVRHAKLKGLLGGWKRVLACDTCGAVEFLV